MAGRVRSNNHQDILSYQFQLPAYSIGSVIAQRTQHQGVIGQIHSVFKHVVNIAFLNGGLGSIVGSEVYRGPLSINVEIPKNMDMLSLGMKNNLSVSRVADLIIIGESELAISIENASLWEPVQLYNDVLSVSDIVERNLMKLREVARSYGKLDGLGLLIELSEDELHDTEVATTLDIVPRLALPHLLNLIQTIKTKDLDNLPESVQHLVGLGPGLTPSGDDFLIGLMLSMLFIARNFKLDIDHIIDVNETIISCIPGRTTSISEEFLFQAATGNANEPILNLIETLLTSNSAQVERATRTVLAIGGTSGTDTILGILFGSLLMLSESTWFHEVIKSENANYE